jgi:putative salt-induced outer membrane protein YdiY
VKKISILLLFFVCFAAMAEANGNLRGRFSLGYSDTKGNTEETKTNIACNLSETKNENLKLNYKGLMTYGKAKDETNADKKQLDVTSEFKKSDYDSYYLSAGYMTDKFSGYDQQNTFGFGYLRYFEREPEKEIRLSLGLDFTNERYTTGTTLDEKWLKAGLGLKRKLYENIQGFSLIDYSIPKENSKDSYKVDAIFGTLFNVNSKFDMEMKYTINYRQAPVDGYKKQDNGFYTSIVYKI